MKPVPTEPGGRLASFTCPRCGYLPDRFLSRRISAQLRLNRLLIAGFIVVQLVGFSFLSYELVLANSTRVRVTAKLQSYMDRADVRQDEMLQRLRSQR